MLFFKELKKTGSDDTEVIARMRSEMLHDERNRVAELQNNERVANDRRLPPLSERMY